MITHVAIKHKGKVYSLPKPNRHHDVIRLIHDTTGESVPSTDIQGFLADGVMFLGRIPAYHYAVYNNQILDMSKVTGSGLSSEDVW